MATSKSATVAQSEGQESVGSWPRDKFVNLDRIKDCDVAQSPSIRAVSILLDHINRSQSQSTSHVSHDKEMHNIKLEVSHLR